MPNGKMPFPQFDDDAFKDGATFIRAVFAWDQRHQLDLPHIVLSYDPETKSFCAVGPYENAFAANEAAVATNAELNSPEHNDGPPVFVAVLPLHTTKKGQA